MPTYEYECSKCKSLFEIVQSMKDEPIKECPTCKGQVKRLIGGGLGIIFKGSGFYSTDNKRSSVSTGDVSKNSTSASTSVKEEKKEDKPAPDSKTTKNEKKSA
jgi:putative FmdB family regulatory protein